MSDIVTQRLKQSHARKMVHLAVQFLMEQPLRELVPVSLVHQQSIVLLQNITQSAQTQQWMIAQIQRLREQMPVGKPKDYVPMDVQIPLREALAQRIPIQQELVHRLLKHKAMEQLFHDVLSSVLLEFTETIKTWGSAASSVTGANTVSKGFGRLMALGEKVVQQTPIGAIASIIEQQAQQRILAFLDKSIAGTIALSATEIAAEKNRQLQAEYRLHILDTLLDTDNSVLWQQLHILEPEFIVKTITNTMRAFLDQQSLQDSIRGFMEESIQNLGDRSVRSFLKEMGIEENTDIMEEYIVDIAIQLIDTPAFQEVLSDLLQP